MLDMATIEIGGNIYTLCFPLGALMKADKLIPHLIQKFTPSDGALPECPIEDLLLLFRIGLHKEHSNIDDKKATELLESFFQEGSSVIQQFLTLYTVLGKAMGFFRTEADPQKMMNEQVQKVFSKK